MLRQPQKVIVCATDFSDASHAAIDLAIELAIRHGATRVFGLHVDEVVERYTTIQHSIDVLEARREELRQQVESEIERMRERLATKTSVKVVTEIRYGKPYLEILRYAVEMKADFLVVGTHGRLGFSRAVLGSVAERVARYAPCTVVIAKSAEAAEHLSQALAARLKA